MRWCDLAHSDDVWKPYIRPMRIGSRVYSMFSYLCTFHSPPHSQRRHRIDKLLLFIDIELSALIDIPHNFQFNFNIIIIFFAHFEDHFRLDWMPIVICLMVLQNLNRKNSHRRRRHSSSRQRWKIDDDNDNNSDDDRQYQKPIAFLLIYWISGIMHTHTRTKEPRFFYSLVCASAAILIVYG